MRRQTKILCFLLAFTFILSFVTFPIAGAEEFEGKSAAPIKDTKNPIYHYTLDDKFVPDRVIVSILHDYSELDKEYSPEDFPGVDVKSIGYLTPLLDPNGDYPYLNRDEYRQILLLFLDTSDKQHVLDMIDVLNENPIVRSAQVDLLGVQEFYEVWDTVLTGYVRDGIEISPADSLYVLQYTVGKVRLNAMQLVAADVDMDGKVTAADALHILQFLVGQNDLCEKIVKWTDDAF